MDKMNVVEKIKVYEGFVYFERYSSVLGLWYELELVDRYGELCRVEFRLLEGLKKEVDRRLEKGVGRYVEL